MGGPGSGEGNKIIPIAIAFDNQNSVLLLYKFLWRVCIYDTNGNFLRSWGKQSEGIGQFDFHEDGDIVMDSQGNLYIAEGVTGSYTGSRTNRIQKFRLVTN